MSDMCVYVCVCGGKTVEKTREKGERGERETHICILYET